jgi:hypothetical protein
LLCDANNGSRNLLNIRLKEKKMFTIDTLVDTGVKNTKAVFAHIPNEDVRTGFEAIVDAQAAFTKTFYNTTVDLAKQSMDSVTQFGTAAKKTK